jgi:hypothetical protein
MTCSLSPGLHDPDRLFLQPSDWPVCFRLEQFLNWMGVLGVQQLRQGADFAGDHRPGPLFSRFRVVEPSKSQYRLSLGNKISLAGEHVGVLWEQAVESIPFLCKSLIWKLKTIGVPEWPAPPGFAHEG